MLREREEDEKQKVEEMKKQEIVSTLKKAKGIARESVAPTDARAGMKLGDFFSAKAKPDDFSSAFEDDQEDVDPEDLDYDEDEDEDLDLDFGECTENATLGGVFDREPEGNEDDDSAREKKTPAQRRREMVQELMAMRSANPKEYEQLLRENPELAKLVSSYAPEDDADHDGSDMDEDEDSDDFGSEEDAEEDEGLNRVHQEKKSSSGPCYSIESLTKEEYLRLRDELSGIKGIAAANRALSRVVTLFRDAGRAYLELSQVRKAELKDAMSGTHKKKEESNLDRNIKAKQLMENKKKSTQQSKLSIRREAELIAMTSTKLFLHFLQYAARAIPIAMATHFLPSEVANDPEAAAAKLQALDSGVTLWAPVALNAHPGWSRVRGAARTYFTTLLNLFASIAEPTMIRILLHHSLPALPYLEELPEFAPKVFKALLVYWAGVAGTSIGSQAVPIPALAPDVRLEAFLAIRRLCVTLPPRSQMLEAALKGVYLTYVRECKNLDAQNATSVNFMTNCVTDLYGIDPVSAYQHAFVYIRQLAVHLRSVIQDPSEEKVRSVYCWQYLNCLRVWSSILAAHAASPESQLRPLVYPFIQVCLGTLDLQNSPNYFPVRIYVAEFLTHLTRATKVYVPLSPYLFSVLRSSLLHKKLTGTTRGIEAFRYRLHISDEMLKSPGYQIYITNATLDQLTNHLAHLSVSIAFPELMLPVKHFIKAFIRGVTPSVAKPARELLSAINESVNIVTQKRSTVTFSPRDLLIRGVSGLTTFDDATNLPGFQLKKKSQRKMTPLEVLWKKRQHLSDVESDIVLGKRRKPGDDQSLGADEEDSSDDEMNTGGVRHASQQRPAEDDDEEAENDEDGTGYYGEEDEDFGTEEDYYGADDTDDEEDDMDLEDRMKQRTEIGEEDEPEDEVMEFSMSEDESEDEAPSKSKRSKAKKSTDKKLSTRSQQEVKRVKTK